MCGVNGSQASVPVDEVVPGDVVLLRAGDTVPGDCLLLESKDLFVDEATLTGETYPVEKVCGVLPADIPLGQRTNSLFLGTHVVSGNSTALVVHIGSDTEFGKVSGRLKLRPPETEFERGIRQFGYLLLEVTVVLVVAIFASTCIWPGPCSKPSCSLSLSQSALPRSCCRPSSASI